MHISIKALLVITSTITIGCYSNWQDLDVFVAKVPCDSTKERVVGLAKLDLLQHEWLPEHNILSIYKNSDAIAVTFNKKGDLLSIVVSKPQIKLLGLFRKQSQPVMSLDCQKNTLN
jgi:hypothetical protein